MPVDSTKISNKDGSRAAANLNYFISHYDILPLQPYFNKDLNAVADSLGKQKGRGNDGLLVDRYELRGVKYEWAKKYLGLNHFALYYYGEDTIERTLIYQINAQGVVRDVKGYDFIFNTGSFADTLAVKFNALTIKHAMLTNKVCKLTIGNETVKFNLQDLTEKLLADTVKLETYRLNTKDYEYQKSYSIPTDQLSLNGQTSHFDVKLEVDNLGFILNNKKPEINSVSFTYLVKQK